VILAASALVRYQHLFRADDFQFGILLLSSSKQFQMSSSSGGRFSNIPTTPSPIRCLL